jgi:hypothetical protein
MKARASGTTSTNVTFYSRTTIGIQKISTVKLVLVNEPNQVAPNTITAFEIEDPPTPVAQISEFDALNNVEVLRPPTAKTVGPVGRGVDPYFQEIEPKHFEVLATRLGNPI